MSLQRCKSVVIYIKICHYNRQNLQNYRTVEAGRDFWRYLVQPSGSENDQQKQVAQGHVQLGFEYLQG